MTNNTVFSLLSAFSFISALLVFIRWIVSTRGGTYYQSEEEADDKVVGYILPDAHGKVLVIRRACGKGNNERKAEGDRGRVEDITRRNA